jgi:hypothetical protein
MLIDDAEHGIRKGTISMCLALQELGINQGTSENVSAG